MIVRIYEDWWIVLAHNETDYKNKISKIKRGDRQGFLTIKEMPQHVIDHIQQEFLGKRISVLTESNERWVGTCQFIGYNENFPSFGFQVTLDRMPIRHVKPSSIEVLPELQDKIWK